MPRFETYRKRAMPTNGTPFVTIQKRGILSLNKAASAALGDPQDVVLMYDPEAKVIGIRPASENDSEYAYSMRGKGSLVVSGQSFTKHYKIDTTESRRRRAYLEDGILCIDLNDPGTLVVGARSKERISDAQLSLDDVDDDVDDIDDGEEEVANDLETLTMDDLFEKLKNAELGGITRQQLEEAVRNAEESGRL